MQGKVQHVDSIKRRTTYHQILDPTTVEVPPSEQIVRDVEKVFESMVTIQKAKRPREELCKALGMGKVLGDSAIREANNVAIIQGIRED